MCRLLEGGQAEACLVNVQAVECRQEGMRACSRVMAPTDQACLALHSRLQQQIQLITTTLGNSRISAAQPQHRAQAAFLLSMVMSRLVVHCKGVAPTQRVCQACMIISVQQATLRSVWFAGRLRRVWCSIPADICAPVSGVQMLAQGQKLRPAHCAGRQSSLA